MIAKFNINKEEKKRLIAFIEEFLGTKAKYNRVPECSYDIGAYTLDRTAALIWSEHVDAELMLERIAEVGFEFEVVQVDKPKRVKRELIMPEAPKEPVIEGITISLPREQFNDEALDNLSRIIASKGTLMKRAFECDDLGIIIDDEKITFPWFKFSSSRSVQAYTEFVEKIGNMAITQKRVSAKEKEIINEKYEFRCFLLRLGFIGDEYKETRKVLLSNLSGSAAFKAGGKS